MWCRTPRARHTSTGGPDMPGRKRLLAIAVAAPLLVAACSAGEEGSGGNGSGGGRSGGDLSFSVITHGSAGDAFWDVVQNGAEAAGEDLGVSVDYRSDGDPQRQAQLVDAAVNQDVDGIVVSMVNPDALQESIAAAVDAGIPVVTINSGGDRSAEFGAIGHVGQDETIAGQGAGGRLAEDGAKKALCVLHEAGNIGLEQRCSGASEGFGGDVMTPEPAGVMTGTTALTEGGVTVRTGEYAPTVPRVALVTSGDGANLSRHSSPSFPGSPAHVPAPSVPT